MCREDIQGNLMAGRAGNAPGHRFRQLLPMSFREYLTATRPSLPLPPVVEPSELLGARIKAGLADLALLTDDYDLAWQDYLTCGGFPRAVAEHFRQGLVSQPYLRDLRSWLRADLDPDGEPESVPLLLADLEASCASPLNLTAAAKRLGYRGRKAFEVRLSRLINAHGLLVCKQRTEFGRAVAGALRKYYLVDPLISWLPSRLSPGLRTPDFTRLSEAALAVALARVIEALDEGRWMAQDTVGYLRTGQGNEIDFGPVRVPGATGPALSVPIESKWVDDGWRAAARVIGAKFPAGGILATKSVLDTDNHIWAVPAPFLAAALG